MTIGVGTSNIIHEVLGSGSGLPTEVRSCVVKAYLDESDAASRAALRHLAAGPLLEAARSLDFSAYIGARQPGPEDIAEELSLPE